MMAHVFHRYIRAGAVPIAGGSMASAVTCTEAAAHHVAVHTGGAGAAGGTDLDPDTTIWD